MASAPPPSVVPLPAFRILHTQAHTVARLGLFSPSAVSRGKPSVSVIPTPNFILPTSRGTIPHITPDNARKHVDVSAVFVSLEDFVDKNALKSPVAQSNRTIRDYISLLPPLSDPDHQIPIFLSPRRSCPVPTSQPNSDNTISIVTNDGFRQLPISDYFTLISQLKDEDTVILAPVDLPLLISAKPPANKPWKHIGGNRVRKMVTRNELWSVSTLKKLAGQNPVIVPLLPGISVAEQAPYLDSILNVEESTRVNGGHARRGIDGINVQELSSPFIPESYEPVENGYDQQQQTTSSRTVDFGHLPSGFNDILRLNLAYQSGPHDVIAAIERGHDLVCGDWITATTDAGVAFTFGIAGNSVSTIGEKSDIGISLWETELYAADLTALSEECECYTCKNHHRAYVAHLLAAKEMLAWTLLQIHNIHTVNRFMSAIRDAIKQDKFIEIAAEFRSKYFPHMQGVTPGGGPRVRGYQVKLAGSVTGKKLNESPFQNFSNDD
ncbi:tRNA-guanine(15) transglycosylase-like protein [Lipomyces kononenkoae]|uniref:tRNA-guanine(15) transglycosylase-like protein n=1 Tax=Lipomyces kononenkoae TaxID=34357 RepID=A0ACC3T028_LIPKO